MPKMSRSSLALALLITLLVASSIGFLLYFYFGQNETSEGGDLPLYISLEYPIDGTVYVLGDKGRIIENISVADGIGQSSQRYSGSVRIFFKSSDQLYVFKAREIALSKTVVYGGVKYYFVQLSSFIHLPDTSTSDIAVLFNNKVVATSLHAVDTINITSDDYQLEVKLIMSDDRDLEEYFDYEEGKPDATYLIVEANSSDITISAEKVEVFENSTYFIIPMSSTAVKISVSGKTGTYKIRFYITNNIYIDDLIPKLAEEDTTLFVYTPEVLVSIQPTISS